MKGGVGVNNFFPKGVEHKKVLFLVTLGGGGGRVGPLRKNNFFEACKALVAGPLET